MTTTQCYTRVKLSLPDGDKGAIYLWNHRADGAQQEEQRARVMAANRLEGRMYGIAENEAWVIMRHPDGSTSMYKICLQWEGAEMHILKPQASLKRMLESYGPAARAVLLHARGFLSDAMYRRMRTIPDLPLWVGYTLGHQAKLAVIEAAGFTVRPTRDPFRGGAVRALANPRVDTTRRITEAENRAMLECDCPE
jgi:hypothetical protein